MRGRGGIRVGERQRGRERFHKPPTDPTVHAKVLCKVHSEVLGEQRIVHEKSCDLGRRLIACNRHRLLPNHPRGVVAPVVVKPLPGVSA